MTATPSFNNEPTLTDVIVRIDKLSTDVERLSTDVEKLSANVNRFDERFADYRQATQWVVQLAFTLIASATITVILTSVLV
jgi:stress response protein SCP2